MLACDLNQINLDGITRTKYQIFIIYYIVIINFKMFLPDWFFLVKMLHNTGKLLRWFFARKSNNLRKRICWRQTFFRRCSERRRRRNLPFPGIETSPTKFGRCTSLSFCCFGSSFRSRSSWSKASFFAEMKSI